MNKQTVYTQMHGEWNENDDTLMNSSGEYVSNLLKQEGYFFTEDELKQLLSDYTDKIVENVKHKDIGEINEDGNYYPHYIVDKESITSQLEPFLKTII